jgi:hypothetical protein
MSKRRVENVSSAGASPEEIPMHAGVRRYPMLLLAAAFAALVFAPRAGAAVDPAQKHFTTPELAVDALIAAVTAQDKAALLGLIGSEAKEVIESGDPVADREAGERFVAAYGEEHRIVKAGDTHAVLEVGEDAWPLPIPIVKDAKGWRFDGEAGEDEIVSRRIGRNELAVIQACLAYVDAQREYYTRNPDGVEPLHYARRFASTPGQHDGLYWPVAEDEEPSPLGPVFDAATAEGYTPGKNAEPAPFHGYYFRILEGQGPKAPGGAYGYLAGNKMVGGFALIAHPAVYGTSGVMTFLVNHDGVVYQRDLGPETATKVKMISLFDLGPDTVAVAEEDTVEIEIGSAPVD